MVNNYLLQVISFKYSLDVHFSVIKKYLLLSQGDFHHLLMESLVSLLNENASSIYKHTISPILEGAIQSSGLKYTGIEFLSRLDIKLLEPSPLDTGWDVFTLDYIVSAPLTTIFTNKAMETYIRAFKLF